MKKGFSALGLLLLLVGIVWIGQGAGFIGGSFMTGQTQWFVIGLFCAIAGLALMVWLNFVRR